MISSHLPMAEPFLNLRPLRQGFVMRKRMFGAIALAMAAAAVAEEAPMTPLRPDQV
jgi:hypothetical protein